MKAIVWRSFVKKLFSKILQNSQENTCAFNFIKKIGSGTGASREFCKVFKNTYFYSTPLVAAFRERFRGGPVIKSIFTLP